MVRRQTEGFVAETNDDVVIKLSRARALALFEWAYRFMETLDSRFTHPADPIAIDTLASELEWKLPEVFTDAYPALLAAARARVAAECRASLGLQQTAWLESLTYQDVPPERHAQP
jgi:hypothetical protein